ncbi:Stomatin-like protein 2 mitochondrial [Bienertia sinuspersici]
MSIGMVARNQALKSSMKLLPNAYNGLSHQILTNSSMQNSMHTTLSSNLINRTFSTSSSSSVHNPYESYRRRTAINTVLNFVPQQEAYVIERFGKYTKVLEPGLRLLLPFVDKIAYVHLLKEQTVEIPEQPAVTTDNVSIHVDGVLFATIVDPVKASYNTDNAMIAVTQLAQTVMRSCIGKMPLDKTFMERATLNANIVEGINAVAEKWGLSCRRYEIRDITPPRAIRESMEKQAEAERNRRAQVIQAEGEKEAKIQRAEGSKRDVVIASQAACENEINRATGYAEALRIRSQADAEAISRINEALNREGGEKAANLQVARAYVEAFSELAKKSTTVMLPSSVDNPSSMITQALTIYKKLNTGEAVKTKEVE